MAKKRKRNNKIKRLAAVCSIFFVALLAVLFFLPKGNKITIDDLKNIEIPEYIDIMLIPVGTSREGIDLESVNDIVIHYVGNPGTTAKQNHDYFANEGTTVNAHFVIGLDGEIIQCVPIYERSSASNHRNSDTISIEVCHPDEGGKFYPKTRESLIKLTAWLCDTCGLGKDNIIRHYDITGKLCPLYYSENQDEWEKRLDDINNYIEKEF
ncbi:MAG: N-acetylmuramoyl-L-alanine amidase [Clostridia bacterium]|nr:N-acetylmuramoyl-L-alanine amidase [Clostridia bacterium]